MIKKQLAQKILSVGCEYFPPEGGIAQVICNYATCIFPEFKYIANSGRTVYVSRYCKLLKALIGLFLLGYRLIIDRKIEIVHIHTASYNSFRRSYLYIILAKLLNRKVVLHMHSGAFMDYYITNPKWITSVLDRCDALIVLSDVWKNYYHSITKCLNIYVVENPIELPVVQIKEKREILHLLFLGTITEGKGIFDLLEVLLEYSDKLRGKIFLHIAGRGKEDVLIKLIDEYNLRDIVVYEGWVYGEKKVRLLLQSDVFILPSYIEGLPVSILEAMSYGMPILSTCIGGIPDIVKNNVNGILFPPGDKKAIFLAIKQLMESRESVIAMGKKSYEFVAPYMPINVERKLADVYESVLR